MAVIHNREHRLRLVFWEATAGCNLECQHCRRLDVARELMRDDLSTAEALSLVDAIAGMAVCFISHKGEVFPCGYLPVEAGHIRRERFADIWNRSLVFTRLRDPDLLGGKCGPCEFKTVCAGCRARAYTTTGDFLAEEPFCTYQPRRQERPRPSRAWGMGASGNASGREGRN